MTFTAKRIIEAVKRGYYVTKDGQLYGPRGKLKISLYGKQRYPTFTTNWSGRVFGLPTHQLAAYCFYGEQAFDPNLVVRHLDGNTCNVSQDNIKLGTHSENNLDKPKHIRRMAAIKARAAQPWSGFNKGKRKHND